MTGFARAQGEDGQQTWVWEAKSVNARGLDLRFRLPPGLDGLEVAARTAASARFKRGNISLGLAISRAADAGTLSINREFLTALAANGRELARELGVAAPTMEGLLRSEEHTSELQSLMRSSYAVFSLKKKNATHT